MAKIEQEELLKKGVEVLSIVDYIEKYQDGLTSQAVSYAMGQDRIDYMQIGFERLVVMTEKTRQYVPNENNRRAGSTERKVRTRRTAIG